MIAPIARTIHFRSSVRYRVRSRPNLRTSRSCDGEVRSDAESDAVTLTSSPPPAGCRTHTYSVGRPGRSIHATDLAEIGTVRDRAADRVERRVTDDEVVVGAVGAEGIVGGRAELRTGLPPAVLATDDPWIETIV